MIVDFPMDSVAGARRTPGRLKTGGVPPKPPAAILLSLWPSVFWDFGSLFRTFRFHLLTRCCGSRIFVHITSETSALCRGTSQQNIPLQMFLQLQTLRRQVSRLVAAGVYPSLKDVAASQCVCSRGADDGFISFFSERCSHICLRVVDDRLGKIVLPIIIYSRLYFFAIQQLKDQHPEEVAGQLFLEGKKQRVVNIVTVSWLVTAGLRGGQILEASSSTCSASHSLLPSASAAPQCFKTV